MKVLQVGAGSMGSRRLRDLAAHEDVTALLLDQRPDRRQSALDRFGVPAVSSLEDALDWEPDVFIVSTPPGEHASFVATAIERANHVFCEADIWPYDYRRVEAAQAGRHLVAAPSCTLYFSSIVEEVRRVVADELGTLHAFGYLLSVDAPSWHPGEGAEYYARHRATAPAREMVAFELIALDHIFGEPTGAAGSVRRRGSLEMASEDTWVLQTELDNGAVGQLAVVMACPQTTRRGWAAGDNGYVTFSLSDGTIERALPAVATDSRQICDWSAELESVYAAELSRFLACVRGEASWPYPYRKSAVVCGTLAAVELSALSGRFEPVSPDRLPAALPDAYVLDSAQPEVRDRERLTSAG
jgi:predicted dehydrogenase